MRLRHIGLLGGTLDPIHSGHLALAGEALAYGLDEVWFIPLLKEDPGCAAPAADRLEMARLALEGKPGMKVIRAGMRHPGTMTEIAERLMEKNPDCRFSFLFGADELTNPDTYLQNGKTELLCGRMCFPRPGTRMEEYLLPAVKAGIRFCIPENAEGPDSCSTNIRAKIQALCDPTETDPRVLRYIALHGLYLPDWAGELKNHITEKRMNHTLGVRSAAVDLAFYWHGPVIKAAVAGLMHDCAKSLPLLEAREMVLRCRPDADEEELSGNAMAHGPAGSILAMEKYGISDPDVLNAIRWHTVGHPGMGLLEKIIFIADMIEPGRENFDGLNKIRSAAYTDLDQAMLLCLKSTKKYVLAQGKPFCQKSEETIRYFETLQKK